MSFLAKMFINDREVNVKYFRFGIFQNKDIAGMPRGRVQGGTMIVRLEMDENTDLYRQCVETETLVQGSIRFYKRDAMSTLREYEFKSTYIYYYRLHQTANGSNPALVEIGLSPGALKVGPVIHIKPWCKDTFEEDTTEVSQDQLAPKRGELVQSYYVNSKGERLKSLSEGKVTLVVETQGLIGEYISIDLADEQYDFKHNGKVLKNDLLENLRINNNIQKIPLEIIKQ